MYSMSYDDSVFLRLVHALAFVMANVQDPNCEYVTERGTSENSRYTEKLPEFISAFCQPLVSKPKI